VTSDIAHQPGTGFDRRSTIACLTALAVVAAGLIHARPAAAAQAVEDCSACEVQVEDTYRSEAGGGRLDHGYMRFTIRSNIRVPVDTWVRYNTVNATALAGSDFRRTSGRAKIAEGTSRTTVRIRIINDRFQEAKEYFWLYLSGVTNGASIDDSVGRGLILDDDPPRFIVFDATRVVEGGSLVFAIKLSRKLAHPTWVRYATKDRVARAGQDYVARSGWLRFPAGTVSRVVTIRTLTDATVDEGWEGMRLYLTTSVGAVMGDRLGRGDILEKDVIP
jgi:hypothetical protein